MGFVRWLDPHHHSLTHLISCFSNDVQLNVPELISYLPSKKRADCNGDDKLTLKKELMGVGLVNPWAFTKIVQKLLSGTSNGVMAQDAMSEGASA